MLSPSSPRGRTPRRGGVMVWLVVFLGVIGGLVALPLGVRMTVWV